MQKEKLLKALKIIVITLLVLAITILVILKWKSDVIMDKVLASVQDQLVDSLQYSEAGMDWFSYFPSTAIQISDLRLGSGKEPLVAGGDVDIVIRLIPLLQGKIIISRLQVTNSTIHIYQREGRWSYEIFKKTAPAEEESLNTKINQLIFENTALVYNDGKALRFNLAIEKGTFKGGLENEILDLDIEMKSLLTDVHMDGYKQTEPFPSVLKGQYIYDMKSGLQEFKDLHLDTEAIQVTSSGTVLRESDHEVVAMEVIWEKGNPELLKKWLPAKEMETWKEYPFEGEVEGHMEINGKSSTKETPHITSTASLKNGSIDFVKAGEKIKGLNLDVLYDNGEGAAGQKSSLEVIFQKGSMLGGSLEGNVKIQNLDKPLYDININGSLPTGLLNLMGVEGLHFDKGAFEIDQFELYRFQPENSTLSTFLQRGKTSLTAKNVSLTYLNNVIEIPAGDFHLEGGKLNISLDGFKWNKASVTELKGWIASREDQLEFTLDGALCEGKIEVKGDVTGMSQQPVSHATWKVKGIEMKQLLESFSNFDQTFITSENLKGKTDIWAESTIPFDDKWNIRTEKVLVRSAIDIKDGQLKGMKTLEDFSKFVHIDDLRDIRFNQLRNYMKIENGTVYLPVMFIQSSALNLSISGEHKFDQDIIYYLKLNAGQVVATKLKKNDLGKDLHKARKSGWINLYYVLSGNTSDVRYQQYRAAVIAGFEQSTGLKESLRNYLVEKFGYDVYWIEPNEWEDIPEYQ